MSEPPARAWWLDTDRDPGTDEASGARGRPLATVRLAATPGADVVAPDLVAPDLEVTDRPDRPDRAGPRGHRRARTAVAVVGVLAVGAACWGVGSVLAADHRPGPVPVPAAFPVDSTGVVAAASSTQDEDGGIGYQAANTLDGDPTTAWNSKGARTGAAGRSAAGRSAAGGGPGGAPGTGAWLSYRFTSPLPLRSVSVLNGYQKVRRRPGKPAVDLYPANERLHRVRVVTDGGSLIWDLADTRRRQTLPLDVGRTATLRLEVVSAYPSTSYPDLAVSEVSFTAATG